MFLASAVSNLYSEDRKVYTTARKPGGNPIPMTEWKRAHDKIVDELAIEPQQPAVTSPRGGYNLRSASRPISQLRLTTRLASNVFLGGCVLLSKMSCSHTLYHMMSENVSGALNNTTWMHASVWRFQASVWFSGATSIPYKTKL